MAEELREPYTVSELTDYIRFVLEENEILRYVRVSGEVSNVTNHSSGHVYFSVKDKNASLSAVMFRSDAARNPGPERGEEVTISGNISVYPPRGAYQIIVRKLEKAGVGDLHKKFLQLKEKLAKEGLFDQELKRPVPRFPSRIGIVTSPTGAVIQDIRNTIKRRYPHVTLTLAPATVQGKPTASSVIQALELLQKLPDLDLIIIARGGGSLEDLWGFNDEALARAVRDCKYPIISGVGHETDFSICDFVADLRAPTPTAAAELAVPDHREIRAFLDESGESMKRALSNFILHHRRELNAHEHNMHRSLVHGLQVRRQMLDDFSYRMKSRIKNRIEQYRSELRSLKKELESYDMRNVLDRGYTLTLKDGKPIVSTKNLKSGDLLRTVMKDGQVNSEIRTIDKKE